MSIDLTSTRALDRLDEHGRALLFTAARSANSFADTPVTDVELAEIYELAKWGPSAANMQPMRVLFVRSAEGKARLGQHLAEGNRAKALSAPAVAVLAYDNRFHEHASTVFPIRPEMQHFFEDNVEQRHETGDFSAALQVGTFIMAVRAAGLAAGPMGGFDRAGVDAEFFPDGRWNSRLVVNIGHPGNGASFDRLPRLPLDAVVAWA